MIPTMELSGARRFVARRERTFYRTLGDVSADIEGQPVLSPEMLAVGSAYFIVTGVIRYDRVESQSETLLERGSDRVEVVWQLRR
jgi:general secretion pathway protein K